MATVELTKARLAALLQEAADAHQEYETELGHPDEAWAEWYAEYVMDELGGGEAGDRPLDDQDLDVIGG